MHHSFYATHFGSAVISCYHELCFSFCAHYKSVLYLFLTLQNVCSSSRTTNKTNNKPCMFITDSSVGNHTATSITYQVVEMKEKSCYMVLVCQNALQLLYQSQGALGVVRQTAGWRVLELSSEKTLNFRPFCRVLGLINSSCSSDRGAVYRGRRTAV